MRVELEFLDANLNRPTRVHEEEFIYDGLPPIPNIGEVFTLTGRSYTVKSRRIYYYDQSVTADLQKQGFSHAEIRVSMQCELLEPK